MLDACFGLTKIISWEALEKAVLEAVPNRSEVLNMEAMQKGFALGINIARRKRA